MMIMKIMNKEMIAVVIIIIMTILTLIIMIIIIIMIIGDARNCGPEAADTIMYTISSYIYIYIYIYIEVSYIHRYIRPIRFVFERT